MSLRDRVLNEMVLNPRAMNIFNDLPSELKTLENLEKIEKRLRVENCRGCTRFRDPGAECMFFGVVIWCVSMGGSS